jgi:hypothetical protein
MAGLTDKERIFLSELWDYDRQDDPPLTERDFKLINWALECLRPPFGDPRPARTALEVRRVCLIAAKLMLEKGLTKKQAFERLLGDGSNGVRYVFKKGVIKDDVLHRYLHQYPDERPERYLRKGLFPPKHRMKMEIEHWEWITGQPITDGAPENW